MKKRRVRAEAFGFPQEVVCGGVNLSIYENVGCCLQNYKSILSYTDFMIRADTRVGIIAISGSGLKMAELSRDTVSITGTISQIIYEDANGLE